MPRTPIEKPGRSIVAIAAGAFVSAALIVAATAAIAPAGAVDALLASLDDPASRCTSPSVPNTK